ncbi:hypothetical protein M405DRAFT_884550 [Rhizopogon salebrosus TDB-379]|nr:hypothetical protein M405DRAFT_884550 [Rhizopogon salebrosus TDB-379]
MQWLMDIPGSTKWPSWDLQSSNASVGAFVVWTPISRISDEAAMTLSSTADTKGHYRTPTHCPECERDQAPPPPSQELVKDWLGPRKDGRKVTAQAIRGAYVWFVISIEHVIQDILPIPLWSAITTMLATVDISPAKDDQAKAIKFTPEFATGLTRFDQEQSTNK